MGLLKSTHAILAILLAQATFSAGQTQINACPTTETTQTVDGKTYIVCTNSDYQGASKEVIQNVADIAACESICSAKSCNKAVYDHIYKSCHMKDDTQTLTWTSNQQFDTFRLTNVNNNQPRVTDGTVITSCPVAETTQTNNGKTYVICPGSDYQASSQQTINNVGSAADCAKLCTTNSCDKAAYNNVNKICYLKVVGTAFNWVAYQGWDSIRVTTTPKAGDGTPITSCPVAETTKTVGSKTYIICPGSDYQAGSKESINGIASAAECAKIASGNVYEKAAYDNVNQICYLKNVGATANWVSYSGWDSIRVTTAKKPAQFGSWGNVIAMPVIPVAAYVVPSYPESSRFMAFSSWSPDNWGGSNGYTQFADYNLKSNTASQRTVSNTRHDMFCPGISALSDGSIVVTGGDDAARTSIYDPSSNSFISGPDMQLARGYQASAILSNGKVFTIGGSWSGGVGGKDGEIFDPNPNARSWTRLSGALVAPMLTNDRGGDHRKDNHGWLFGWKDGSVFQAGPSKNMNWYTTSGNGGYRSAGTRSGDDAMCGVFAMYDAVNGKIFTAGGSPDYQDTLATASSYGLTITNVGAAPSVERFPDMTFARGFANGVILPDGQVVITGGQRLPIPFKDGGSVMAAEIFNPKTKQITVMASSVTPRNYHSVSLLLPDGTVMAGGGGLCGSAPGGNDGGCDRSVDHKNFEIFTPPYLYNSDGSLATRPVISSVSSSVASNGYSAKVGGTLTVTMSNSNTGMTFSLVRLGSSTHSVNTDQRRVPLTSVSQSGSKFTFTLPGDAGVLMPGAYYLFAMNSAGVPSMSKTVKVTT